MSHLWDYDQWDGPGRGGRRPKALLKKLRQETIQLAALGLSYSRAGKLLGFAKSTLCKWLKREPPPLWQIPSAVLEMDGLFCHTEGRKAELKVVRDGQGIARLSFGGWSEVLDGLFQEGMETISHVVSDGDKAIEEALALVYGGDVPHQLCHFHLLQEYRRNVGKAGWGAAKALLRSTSLEEAWERAREVERLTGGKGAYWCRKVLDKGLTFLTTGEERWKTVSRLERFQRELRGRERLGVCWSGHNLEVLLAHAVLATLPT